MQLQKSIHPDEMRTKKDNPFGQPKCVDPNVAQPISCWKDVRDEGPLPMSSERISQEISGGLFRGKQDSECLRAEEFPEGDQNSSSVEPIYTTDGHWTKSTFPTHCPTACRNNSGKVISA
jgi:hypothetical protein